MTMPETEETAKALPASNGVPAGIPIKPMFYAVAAALAAASGECACQPCSILRKVAPELSSFIVNMVDTPGGK